MSMRNVASRASPRVSRAVKTSVGAQFTGYGTGPGGISRNREPVRDRGAWASGCGVRGRNVPTASLAIRLAKADNGGWTGEDRTMRSRVLPKLEDKVATLGILVASVVFAQLPLFPLFAFLNFRKKRGLRNLGNMGVSEVHIELLDVRPNGRDAPNSG